MPTRLWILTRHGVKYPSDDIMENLSIKLIPDIQENLIKLYGDKNGDNFLKLKKDQKKIIVGIMKWDNILDDGTHKDLTSVGKSSMLALGQRLNTKFKNLAKILTKEDIEVNITR